ncbi:hypothetical protein EDC01DRAFT_287288 [Geopyxis carbonaria]|nr:hypothetical protein EDC01DRAFT_287288 [Geopyxis carbonaria]
MMRPLRLLLCIYAGAAGHPASVALSRRSVSVSASASVPGDRRPCTVDPRGVNEWKRRPSAPGLLRPTVLPLSARPFQTWVCCSCPSRIQPIAAAAAPSIRFQMQPPTTVQEQITNSPPIQRPSANGLVSRGRSKRRPTSLICVPRR